MNTVTDLRKALAEEMNLLQPPAGLEARVLEQSLRSAATTDRSRRQARPVVTRPAPRLMAIVAALLAVLIMVSLVLASRALHPTPIAPARPGPPPTTHPANGLIAVSANPNNIGGGEVGDVYLVPAGAPARRIIGSNGDGVAQACPRFSPDGRWLAYGEARASDPVTTFRGVWPVTNRAVVVVGINDRGDASPPILRVTLPRDPGQIACPEWSPNGRHIAFRVGRDLWVADSSSGKATVFRVTEAPWGQQAFAWSRDGSLIAVAEPGWIRVVRMDGGASTLIRAAATQLGFKVTDATPASLGWTAGDKKIVYISTAVGGIDGLAVKIVDADGNRDTQLTPDSVDPPQHRVHHAAVSPDGTRVAFAQSTTPCASYVCESVFVMNTDGSNVVELPIRRSGYGVAGLQWSPDGENLLLGSYAGVVSVGVAPGSPEVVYSGGELNLEWSGSQVTWQPLFR